MRRLSSVILLVWGSFSMLAQSPHGEELKLDCAECHNSSGWEVTLAEVSFDHGTTSFELDGSHAQTDCRMCHESMIFSEVTSTCISCHEDVHSMSVGDDCIRCHTPESWLVDMIPELHEENGFPLIGAHGNLSCVECHTSETNLRFDRIGNECISCHQDDYLATENPDHETAGYGIECTDCHNPLGFGWEADPIAHDFFPLRLGHDIQECIACHTSGSFTDAPSDCIACHATDYASASNPSHTDLGLSTDCKSCHTLDLDWMPARFDIHNDYYPLNGAHANMDCALCHNGDYNTSLPTDCYGCHQDDYNNANDPNHRDAGFSIDCTVCHSEDKWEPANFDHDSEFFPIYSGKHKGEWNACTDCHQVAGDYAVFTCLTCHQRGDTDGEHDDVPDYQYESNACLACHPDGKE